MSLVDDINKKKQLFPPEFTKWKNAPSQDNLAAVLKTMEPTVQSALTSYGGGNPTLETRAWILAQEALTTFDPEKGANLKTHVYNSLQRLQRIRAERSSNLHIPEQVRLDAAAINKHIREYVDQYGVEPSDLEISDTLALSMKRIKKTREQGEASESQATTEKGEAMVRAGKDKFAIWRDYVYHDLDERGRKVMEWTTGYNGVSILPKKDIAQRLGISPAAVSLRVSTIAKRLEEGLG